MNPRHVYPGVEAARAIAEQCWHISEAGLAELEQHARRSLDESYTRHVAQQRSSWWADRAMAEAATLESGVAVISIHGVIWPKMSFAVWWRDGCALDVFSAAFTAAVEDPACKAILLDIDSPGGLATGCEEASRLVYDARGAKPIVAMASSKAACSAAYYIGSAADEFVASPSSVVGSIGAIRWHEDRSGLLKTLGIRMTPIKSSPHKDDGNPYRPLSEQAAEALQEYIDDLGGQFVSAVARNRGISEQAVLEDYGQGSFFLAPRALEQGLVDRLATFSEVLEELAGIDTSPPPISTIREDPEMTKDAPKPAEEQTQTPDAETKTPASEAEAKTPAAGNTPTPQPPAAQSPSDPQPGAAAAAAQTEKTIDPAAEARNEALEIVARCKLAGVDPTSYLQAGLSVSEVADKLLAHVCQERQLTPDPGEPDTKTKKPDDELREQYRANAAFARQGISEDRYVELITGGQVSHLDTACAIQLADASQ